MLMLHYLSALKSALRKIFGRFSLTRSTGLSASRPRKSWVILASCCVYVTCQAQGSIPSTADTFMHTSLVPIFEFEKGWIPPSTKTATVKLADFPSVHVHKLTLTCTFNEPIDPGTQFAVDISHWQPFPERFSLAWRVETGRLVVDIACPTGIDLQPAQLLTIRWEASPPNSPMPSEIMKIDGIVITDNIDGFRQSWLPPQRWIEKPSR